MKKQLSIWLFSLTFLATAQASASKFDILGGFFSLSAKTDQAEGEFSNFGSYRVNYLTPVHRQIEFGLGYSVAMSSIIGGDMAFGFDLGLFYFPISSSSEYRSSSDEAKLYFQEIWRPFISASFNQRQFQSVDANYAGYSFGAGVERIFNQNLNLKAEMRLLFLSGAQNGEATQIDLLTGISLPF